MYQSTTNAQPYFALYQCNFRPFKIYVMQFNFKGTTFATDNLVHTPN